MAEIPALECSIRTTPKLLMVTAMASASQPGKWVSCFCDVFSSMVSMQSFLPPKRNFFRYLLYYNRKNVTMLYLYRRNSSPHLQFTRAIRKTASLMLSAASQLIFAHDQALPSLHCIRKKLPVAGSVGMLMQPDFHASMESVYKSIRVNCNAYFSKNNTYCS